MKTRAKMVVLAFIGVLCFLVLLQPVWLRFQAGPLQGDARVLVLNPFRDRSSEKLAEGLLRGLSSGHEDEALAQVSGIDANERVKVARREHETPIRDWHLVYMTNAGGVRTLRYSLKTADGRFCCGVAFITLKENNHVWSIDDYNRLY
jgi:hypothetical protein